MAGKNISGGVVHDLPPDMRAVLTKDAAMRAAWEDITPIARNEWICWIESAKKDATREKRLRIAQENLSAGQRRPCCWPGCPHRKATA